METVENYLKFLLQFAIRDEEFTSSRAFTQNEYEKLRVRMSPKPMIVIEVRIRKNMTEKKDKDSNGGETKGTEASGKMFSYQIITKPPLEDVWTDFNSMVEMFVSSVSRIRRIDEMVIPQLKLKRNTLGQIEKNKNQKLLYLSKLIQGVIDGMRI